MSSYGYMTLLNNNVWYGSQIRYEDIGQATLVEQVGIDGKYAVVKMSEDTTSKFLVVDEIKVFDGLPALLIEVVKLDSKLMFVRNQWDYNDDLEYAIDDIEVNDFVRAHPLTVGEKFVVGPYVNNSEGAPLVGTVFTVADINNHVFKTESNTSEVIDNIDDGNDDNYEIGDTLTFNLEDEGFITMRLVKKNADILSDGSGYAKTTWIADVMLKNWERMNPAYSNGQDGYGAMGGYEASELAYTVSALEAMLPEKIRNSIKDVDKYHMAFVDGNDKDRVEQKTSLRVWIPSAREMYGDGYETQGPTYADYFKKDASRVKVNTDTGVASRPYWLRTANSKNNFYIVLTNGAISGNDPTNHYGVVIGFCI